MSQYLSTLGYLVLSAEDAWTQLSHGTDGSLVSMNFKKGIYVFSKVNINIYMGIYLFCLRICHKLERVNYFGQSLF